MSEPGVCRLLLLSWVALMTSVHAAPVVTIEGRLTRRDVPEEGVFAATIELVDDDGDELVALDVPQLTVIDGAFSVDVDLEAATDALVAGEVISLHVNLGDGLERRLQVGTVFGAVHAAHADRALLVRTAATLGDIPVSDLVADHSILAVPVAFANLTDVPAGIADGVDSGNIDTLSGLVVSDGLLDVAAGAVTAVVEGSITSAQVADGSIGSTQLGGLSAAKVADGTLTGEDFATGAFGSSDVRGTTQLYLRARGCDAPLTLTTDPRCDRRACVIQNVNCVSFVCRHNCTTEVCENLGTLPNNEVRTCIGTGEGVTPVGRLINAP
jgi:hypothetical protein